MTTRESIAKIRSHTGLILIAVAYKHDVRHIKVSKAEILWQLRDGFDADGPAPWIPEVSDQDGALILDINHDY